MGTLCPASKLAKLPCGSKMGLEFGVLELISKRQNDIGTKCCWDIWLLGQNVIGTFGIWDNSLFFGTHMHWDKRYWDKMSLGQFTCGQKDSPRMILSLEQKAGWTYL